MNCPTPKPLLLTLALGICLILAGCGRGRGDLSGSVSSQGKKLQSGSVLVLGADGLTKSSAIEADGKYHVANIEAGSIKVAVNSPEPAKVKVALRKKGQVPPKADQSKWFPIPDKYGDFNKSELTFNLQAGANSWDIDLK